MPVSKIGFVDNLFINKMEYTLNTKKTKMQSLKNFFANIILLFVPTKKRGIDLNKKFFAVQNLHKNGSPLTHEQIFTVLRTGITFDEIIGYKAKLGKGMTISMYLATDAVLSQKKHDERKLVKALEAAEIAKTKAPIMAELAELKARKLVSEADTAAVSKAFDLQNAFRPASEPQPAPAKSWFNFGGLFG